MISIVVPVFNEQEVLRELYRCVSNVMKQVAMPFELILVNDGSTDQSLDIMLELWQQDKNVKVIDLSRNFGHQMAIMAGLEYTCGDAVITMDGDLQHPPELIDAFIKKWQQGYEVVYTSRDHTGDASLFKTMTSRLFYTIVNRLAEVHIPPGAADFRLLDRKVVEAIRALGERAVFLRGLVSWVGYRQTAIRYEAAARHGGKSKYSIIRMLRFATDGVTSFSSIPLYISAFIGILMSMLGFIYGAFAIYARMFTDRVVEGWTSVIVAVLFLGGINLITLGIQGTYLARIYNEVKGRPRYFIRRTYGVDQ
ncbi:MAG: glycosyltransferase family 2 protein [Candidatus Entotheonellia bacterium]